MLNDNKVWLTIKEVSKETGKTPTGIRSSIKRKKIVRVKKKQTGKRFYWLIHKDECKQLIPQEHNEVIQPDNSEKQEMISLEGSDHQVKSLEKSKVEFIQKYEQMLKMSQIKFKEVESKIKCSQKELGQILQKLETEQQELEQSLQAELNKLCLSFESSDLENQLKEQNLKLEAELFSAKEKSKKQEEELQAIQIKAQNANVQIEKLKTQLLNMTKKKQQAEDKISQLEKEREVAIQKYLFGRKAKKLKNRSNINAVKVS